MKAGDLLVDFSAQIDMLLEPFEKEVSISGSLLSLRAFLEAGVSYIATTNSDLTSPIRKIIKETELETGLILDEFNSPDGAVEGAIGAAMGGLSSAVILTGSQIISIIDCIRRLPLMLLPGGLCILAVEEAGIAIKQVAISAYFPTFETSEGINIHSLIRTAYNISRRLRAPLLLRISHGDWIGQHRVFLDNLPDGKHQSEPIFPDTGDYSFGSVQLDEAQKRAEEILALVEDYELSTVLSKGAKEKEGINPQSLPPITQADRAYSSLMEKLMDKKRMGFFVFHSILGGFLSHFKTIRKDYIVSTNPFACCCGLSAAGIKEPMAVVPIDIFLSNQGGGMLKNIMEMRPITGIVLAPYGLNVDGISLSISGMLGFLVKDIQTVNTKCPMDISKWADREKKDAFRLLLMAHGQDKGCDLNENQ